MLRLQVMIWVRVCGMRYVSACWKIWCIRLKSSCECMMRCDGER
jgi:hypothetical protein